MTIKRIKIQNLLSFGPKGIDLELKPLNVLIGPNGCGKSNLLAAISLFQAAPTDIGKPIKESDGIKNWLWKRDTSVRSTLELKLSIGDMEELTHSIIIGSEDSAFTIIDEKIKNTNNKKILLPTDLLDEITEVSELAKIIDSSMKTSIDKSILVAAPLLIFVNKCESAGTLSFNISRTYKSINIYSEYRFGVKNTLRFPQNIDRNNKILNDDLSNLFSILHNLKSDESYERVKSYLSDLNQGYSGYEIVKDEDDLLRFYMLENNEKIPISRLSEGTIRYLCLIAILCNKYKPVLCCIEEPELGMHGDLILTIGRMINEYKDENFKLIVTTHSSLFIDCLEPEDVIVCEKHDGETTMERLNGEYLKEWLKDYTLGHVWSSGQIGGNRW